MMSLVKIVPSAQLVRLCWVNIVPCTERSLVLLSSAWGWGVCGTWLRDVSLSYLCFSVPLSLPLFLKDINKIIFLKNQIKNKTLIHMEKKLYHPDE